MTWPEWCAHYLAQFRPREQHKIADRLRTLIETHYRKTTHPIAVRRPHPLTGFSWSFLFTIAMRGDLKGRKQQATTVAGREPAALWAAYADDLAESIADGTTADLAYPRPFPTDPYALIPDRYKDPA
jgi:hypothetical protein